MSKKSTVSSTTPTTIPHATISLGRTPSPKNPLASAAKRPACGAGNSAPPIPPVPALIDPVEIPFEFRRIQAANLVNWKATSTHAEFDEFLGSIGSLVGSDGEAEKKAREEAQRRKEAEIQERERRRKRALWIGSAAAVLLIVVLIIGFSSGIFTGRSGCRFCRNSFTKKFCVKWHNIR